MKKVLALVFVLCLAVSVTACGESEPSENGHVADQYHQLLENEDATYYYEASVVEQFMDMDGEEPVESIMGEGRDGKDKFVILAGEKSLDQREIETEDRYYTIFDPDKEYTIEMRETDLEGEAAGEEEEDVDLTYTDTGEMEIDGKSYRYDEYQGEFDMETFSEDPKDEGKTETYLYIKRYLVDKKGKLYAVAYLNELKGSGGASNELIYQRIDTITKFQEGTVPEGVFDIPKDYKEVNYDDEEYEDEAILEEE